MHDNARRGLSLSLFASLVSAPSLSPGRAPGYSRGRRSSTAAGPSFHNATLTRSAINESLAMHRQKNTRIRWDRCIIKKVVRRGMPVSWIAASDVPTLAISGLWKTWRDWIHRYENCARSSKLLRLFQHLWKRDYAVICARDN